ncbi:MAG: family oxidoreductase, partial [Paucimonas sp.]|nr:family oxidoreductase [Paucimonas sp.]
MKHFKERVAVVTGAASGLGRAIALTAARKGMRLVLADVDEPGLAATREQAEACGAETLTLRCDVSDAEQVKTLADLSVNRFGRVHLLFNNAGVGCGGFLWENSEADWKWVLGVNLWGVINGVRAFVPLMLEWAEQDEKYEGRVINTSSLAGILNAPALGPYNVSKHAVVSLSETLYHDLTYNTDRVSASVLCPFYVATGIGDSGRNRPPALDDGRATFPSRAAADTLTRAALDAATMSAPEVAEEVFQGICEDRFYIFPQEEMLVAASGRFKN